MISEVTVGYSDGKYNSTAITDSGNLVKKGPQVWQSRDKLWWERTHESSFNSRYLENEYNNSVALDDSFERDESNQSSTDAFPISLNPGFDLQALVMVRSNCIIVGILNRDLVWYMCTRSVL